MPVVSQVRKGAYFDSVTLMRVGRELAALPGVDDAAAVMGTQSNRAILSAARLLTASAGSAADTDLILAVRAGKPAAAQAALEKAEALLKDAGRRSAAAGEPEPADLDAALQALPGARLALISVAGRYAGAEAMKALERGLHVMLFSDNVPIETEIALKTFARRRGLLVMGPDCGTAIINGVPLAFANVVRRGGIGVVAAAGTGLQEVSCLISHAGAGLSQAIGTGGRDVKKAVGGVMFIEGLKALLADRDTKVILLISKPPDPVVAARIAALVRRARKPVVSLLLGARGAKAGPRTLEEAAAISVALANGRPAEQALRELAARDARAIPDAARREAARLRKPRRFVRGLFSGGTFCAEAQLILEDRVAPLYSNAPVGRAKPLSDALRSRAHTVVDLGEDAFTVGRPHPMIDYSLRNRRIAQEAADPETAVILLDVVLGYGSHPDPAAEIGPVLRAARRKAAVVCSVTGTDADPQHRGRVARALQRAGAIVMPSNAAACRLAAEIAGRLG